MMNNVTTEAHIRSIEDSSLGILDDFKQEFYYDEVERLRNNLIDMKTAIKYDEMMDKLQSYSSFDSLQYNNIRSDKYTVQSITSIDNKILISAYKRKHNSRIYVYDFDTKNYEGVIILDNKAHVGGISYDKNHEILYVTGSNGEINSYDYRVIKNYNKSNDKYVIDFSDNEEGKLEDKLEIKINNNINVKNLDEDAEASTIYYYNDRLYVATFNPVNNGYLYSYKVNYNEKEKKITIIDEHTKKYRIGARIQGIGLTSIGNNEYLVCTQSIGITKSVFLLYEISDEKLTFLGRKYLDDPGLEGITIDNEGYIVGIFENNERNVVVINIRNLIREVSDSWLDYNPGNGICAYIGGEIYKLTH